MYLHKVLKKLHNVETEFSCVWDTISASKEFVPKTFVIKVFGTNSRSIKVFGLCQSKPYENHSQNYN